MASATAAILDEQRAHRRGQLYVALAAIAWSSAGVLQRGVEANAAAQVGVRALFACVALGLYVAVAEHGRVAEAWRAIGLAGIGFAVALASASAAFIVALNHTTVAHVLFIQAIAPVLAALLAWALLGEAVSARTTVAMATALAGVAIMVGGPGGGDLVGDGLSLVMALSFAQVLLVVAFLPFADVGGLATDDVLALGALGAGQIGLGLVFLTIGARLIPAAQVALITLLEVVLGPLWVWLSIGEEPTAATLVGGAVVVVAVVILARGRPAPVRALP
jgi:drug/metabolite transporter (DMT)-like permease